MEKKASDMRKMKNNSINSNLNKTTALAFK